MEASIARLRASLGDVLRYYPMVLRNGFMSSSSSSSAAAASCHDASADAVGMSLMAHAATSWPADDADDMADAVEGFLTELTRVLSIGLCEGDGFELWSVLELLECVPDRVQAAAEAEVRSPIPKSLATSPAPVKKAPTTAAADSRSQVSAVARRGALQQTSPAVAAAPHTATNVTTSKLIAAPQDTAQGDVRTGEAADEGGSTSWRHHLSRFHFASQLVYMVRSTFPAAPHALQTRILLRLALNQGCLLASLELLRWWCRTELDSFYASSGSRQRTSQGRRTSSGSEREKGALSQLSTVDNNNSSSSGGGGGGALLTQPDVDSDVWNSFVAAIAPVAGPPALEIAAGAPRTAALPFHLQLFVAGLDDGSAASLEFYTQLQSYVQGRRSTRPSALVCYRASQQRCTRGTDASATAPPFSFLSGVDTAAGSPARRRASAAPAQQHVLQVEALPISRVKSTSNNDSAALPRRDNSGVGGVADTTLTSQEDSSNCTSTRQRQRRHHRRRKHLTRSDATEEGANAGMMGGDTYGDEASSTQTRSFSSPSSTSSATSPSLTRCPPSHCSSSSVVSSQARRHRRHRRPVASSSPQQQQEQLNDTVVPLEPCAATKTTHEKEATEARERNLCSDSRSGGVSPLCSHAAHVTSRKGEVDASASSLSPELAELQARALQCWAVAVAHAESQERRRLGARDVDANGTAAVQ